MSQLHTTLLFSTKFGVVVAVNVPITSLFESRLRNLLPEIEMSLTSEIIVSLDILLFIIVCKLFPIFATSKPFDVNWANTLPSLSQDIKY